VTGVRVTLSVNGIRHELDVEPRRTLAEVLRDECGLDSVHVDCADGTCGVCTVLVGDEAVRGCLMLGVQCEGADVRTVERPSVEGPGVEELIGDQPRRVS
jgi:carbon-monoxide dehydrogenase small subunit